MGRNRSNATAPAVKGDLVAGTGVDTSGVLALGSNGDTLVADSSTSTGLRYQSSQPAGKNIVINGGFDIWQRGTSGTPGTGVYSVADRWYAQNASAATVSQQTTGAPNGSRYVLRIAGTANGQFCNFAQIIETNNAQQLWGQTSVLSLKLRRNASFATTVTAYVQKSATVDAGNGATWTTISSKTIANASMPTGTGVTDWFSDSFTAAIPNDGTANSLRVLIAADAAFTATGQHFEMAQVQLELGSVATTFSRAGGTIQGELAACQRYYYRTGGNAGASSFGIVGYGQAFSTIGAYCHIPLPTAMRVKPTIIDTSAMSTLWLVDGVTTFTPTSIVSDTNVTNQNTAVVIINGSGFTQYRFYQVTCNNTGSGFGFVGMSAEL
jgi:hypothetical protein